MSGSQPGPHQGQPVRYMGAPLERARTAMIMLHGRGATAESILTLVPEIDQAEFAYLAPQAAANSWWPNSFRAPVESNEPGFSSALAAVGDALKLVQQVGIPLEKTVLLGFSQGACLALEFAARNARRYGGVVGLSGGLLGPDGTPRDYKGSLDGAPVFVGCSDVDPHIPLARVHETADVLRRLGGGVTERIYPNMEHTINPDEVDFVRNITASLLD